jgi:hypothetical protein
MKALEKLLLVVGKLLTGEKTLLVGCRGQGYKQFQPDLAREDIRNNQTFRYMWASKVRTHQITQERRQLNLKTPQSDKTNLLSYRMEDNLQPHKDRSKRILRNKIKFNKSI